MLLAFLFLVETLIIIKKRVHIYLCAPLYNDTLFVKINPCIQKQLKNIKSKSLDLMLYIFFFFRVPSQHNIIFLNDRKKLIQILLRTDRYTFINLKIFFLL